MCKRAACVHWAVVVNGVVERPRGARSVLLRGSSGFHPLRSLAAPLTDCHGILFLNFGHLSLSLSASALIAFPPHYLRRTSLCFSPLSFLCLVLLFGFYWSPFILDRTLLWLFMNTLWGSLRSFDKCFLFFSPTDINYTDNFQAYRDVFSIKCKKINNFDLEF